jgi:glycosyltransferase involved in cell wall biosynthesis
MGKNVVVVMAIYNPNIDWLNAQLCSIEAQEYAEIEVIAIDDASNIVSHDVIEEAFCRNLLNTRYKLLKNEENLGSDKAFELLTEIAEDYEYISYCDQDDVWLPNKTAELVAALEKSGATLAYSDLSVIDAQGRHVADSLSHVRRRLHFLEGGGLAGELLFRNFTNGTAMMTRLKTAKSAMPFMKNITADHWLTLWCALCGELVFVPQCLVNYRIHGSNQSAVMAGVVDKQSYLEKRIMPGFSRFEQFKERTGSFEEYIDLIDEGLKWFHARRVWFSDAKRPRDVWKYRHLGKHVSLFELVCARLPNFLFKLAVRIVKRWI